LNDADELSIINLMLNQQWSSDWRWSTKLNQLTFWKWIHCHHGQDGCMTNGLCVQNN